jgi:hypothetical protein
VHQRLVTVIDALVAAEDQAVATIQKKDQTGLKAAQAAGKPVEGQINSVLQSFVPFLGGQTP